MSSNRKRKLNVGAKNGERSQKGKKNKAVADLELDVHKPQRLIYPEKIKNKNVIYFLKQSQSGNMSSAINDRIKQWAVIKQISEFTAIQDTFGARITAICWHRAMSQQNTLAIGIKNGQILVSKVCPITKQYENLTEFPEIGKGNAIYSLKFDPVIDDCLYAACWDGTVTAKSVETGLSSTLISKSLANQWFSTLDVSKDGDFIVAGCTWGRLHVCDKNGKILFNECIHPQRILSVQLCPRDKNLLATTSLDKTVKLWDLRFLKDRRHFTMELHHKSPPAIATFSISGCNQLLTSDQNSEVRVYSAGNWKLLTVIRHPHRQFMHITPIKAQWHPTSDVILIGRYPDKNFDTFGENEPRTIDFFCPSTGKMLYQLLKPGVTNQIASVNVFNYSGNILASGRNQTLVLWSKYQTDRIM